MTSFDYDLFVIGAGSGGVRASRMAASFGARVAVAEDMFLGGTCVNVGCVPKKLFVYASHYAEEFHDAKGFGWSVGARDHHWPTLIGNKNNEIERLNGIYGNLLKNAGVELIDGRATIVDAHTVEVGERTFTAERILVAVGGWPMVPDIPGKEFAATSNEAFYLEERPERVIVVGGGYIAVEFAGIFKGLGSQVTQLYRGPLFLRGFDEDVRHHLAGEMRKKGVDLKFDSNIASIEKFEKGLRATLEDGSVLEADFIMYATGRVPKTEGLGLEQAGVELDRKGAIKVDEDFRTSVPSIYAIGDVIDRVALTPVALAEGMVFSHNNYNGEARKMDYQFIPTAVFSQPNIGTCGLTEEEARAQYGEVTLYKSEFRALKHTLSGSDERTFMKLIVDKASDKVVGAHMVGPDAGEIMQGIGIAMKMGATKADFDATIGIHPTSAEEFVTMRTPAN
ncbi:glutathione-disulfide reductase [Aestuariispira insulae]|uniref:Glutathione reductase n=1 Tax=Aestuariispira insulae TaxID=1461337 RepID=A0A3D9HWR0_9PROT|nr:glutathione-disulfide reductase [Aestuariispira insulae]RED53942.1 NADPH-glutathione reductase [Aestuariispira insulae]